MFYYPITVWHGLFYKLALLIVLIPTHHLWAVEEFYTLDVGQGNCQLSVYPMDQSDATKGNMAVLSDCGSSSSQKHPKFKIFDFKSWNELLKSTRDISVRAELAMPPPKTPPRPRRSKTQPPATVDLSGSPARSPLRRTASVGHGIGSSKEHKGMIRTLLESLDIRHFLIFLSHPDKDHISFVSEGGVLDGFKDTPVTAFLSGDWLGEGGADTSGTKLSLPVFSTLKHLMTRSNTFVELPYYWGMDSSASILEKTERVTSDYAALMNDLMHKFSEKGRDSLSHEELQNHRLGEQAPVFFRGPLTDLLVKAKKEGHYADKLIPKYIRDNIYIWGMNHPARDANDQSLILSTTFPSMNLTAIMTGDAHQAVFQRISNEIQETTKQPHPSDILRTTLGRSADHTVLLTLPHHGSRANISGVMDRLFNPSAVIISAGNGAMYEHPDEKVIQHYLDRNSDIFQRYDSLMKTYGCLAFKRNGTVVEGVRFRTARDKGTPVLCTNMYGSLLVKGASIYFQSPNVFDFEEELYIVKWEESVAVVEGPTFPSFVSIGGDTYTKIEGEVTRQPFVTHLYKSGRKFLLGIPMGDKKAPIIKFYPTDLLEDEKMPTKQ